LQDCDAYGATSFCPLPHMTGRRDKNKLPDHGLMKQQEVQNKAA